MRAVLISVLLIVTIVPLRADDLADLPQIACEQASTPLEREHIGCPRAAVATVDHSRDDAVRFEQADTAPSD